jgi:F-type H+-transporting ATPase subunit b
MEILTQIQIVLAHGGEFGINTDIYETNLINQILIIPILAYAFSAVGVGEGLEARQKKIINLVQDSEKRLSEASDRLTETKKQLSQAFLIIDEIQKETNLIKIDFLNNDYKETKNELNRRFTIAITTLKNRERLILIEIKQNIAFLALKQVVTTLEKELNAPENSWSNKYMEESIKMVGLKNQPANIK